MPTTDNREYPLIEENETDLPEAVNDALHAVDADVSSIEERVTTLETTGVPATVAWSDITDKPATFAPSSHSHPISDVTDLSTALAAKAAADDYRIRSRPLVIDITSLGALIILTDTQCRSFLIKIRGTLSANVVIEFLNLNLDWKLIDETTRAGFTLSIRKTGGSSTLVSAGEIIEFYADGI
jgi:hypothetical protein